MEHSEQEEMKISAATVRRLRAEHGWSQEQLAAVSGLSLRTIQRVEAEGSASLETRTSLAAAFAVPLAELAAAPLTQERARKGASRPCLTRYKVAAVIAGVACIPAALGVAGILPSGVAWLGTVSIMIVLALGIYAGFGWYMTGASARRSRLRHVAQAFFIFGGISCAMALASPTGGASLVSTALAGVLAIIIYFVVDYFASGSSNLDEPAGDA